LRRIDYTSIDVHLVTKLINSFWVEVDNFNFYKGILVIIGYLETEICGRFTCEQVENKIVGKYTGKTLPHYFPGGGETTIKIAIDETGRIILAQAVGENASMRINTLACAIMSGMDILDFEKMETSYAPPVAPPLDPMTLAAGVVRYRYERRK
jgi:hypothetical protein